MPSLQLLHLLSAVILANFYTSLLLHFIICKIKWLGLINLRLTFQSCNPSILYKAPQLSYYHCKFLSSRILSRCMDKTFWSEGGWLDICILIHIVFFLSLNNPGNSLFLENIYLSMEMETITTKIDHKILVVIFLN